MNKIKDNFQKEATQLITDGDTEDGSDPMYDLKTNLASRRSLIAVFCTALFFISASTLNSDKYFEIAKNIEIYTSIYKELNNHYVDDLDPNSLMRTGIDAMMNSLDPYTVYYSESQVESYRISTEGRYNGLGAMSQSIDDMVTITEIYKDGPSEKAGLKVGDQILAVNGRSTSGRSYEDVVQFIRGYPGTDLSLSIKRPFEKKPLAFTLTREEVDIPNVPYYGMVSDEVGYVALSTFTRNAGRNVGNAIRELRDDHGMTGLILDLRNNGGGLLAEAINIVGLFVPKGSHVVSTKGKVRDRDQSYRTQRLPIDLDLPLVVLINKSSASASEIVAGSIQDYDRGILMGQRSFGKGLVQNHREVGYNSRIKVTTSKYYIPSGRCIQSVEYEDGEPKDIDDGKRAVFETRNGRKVLDGGGVTPDVKLDPESLSEAMTSLISQNHLFKYVNKYIHQNPEPQSIEAIKFDAFDDFKGYLEENEFDYTTKTEDLIAEFEKHDANGLFSTELNSIKERTTKEKSDDLDENRARIIRLLEIELAKRHYLQEGKTRQNLKSDSEIESAIALLSDIEAYESILE